MAASSSTAMPTDAPPAPTSLVDVATAAGPWLLQWVQRHDQQSDQQGYQHSATLGSLFQTCKTVRDAVLQHRTTIAGFRVPIAAEDFPAEVERLCTVARSSSSVRLEFSGPGDGYGPAAWTGTEPQITHLLVCAMAQLEGEQPLACVKEIALQDLEQTSMVPAWVKVLCPNATQLRLTDNTLATHPLPQPSGHPHLQQLRWDADWVLLGSPPAEHVRQLLAALPSLTSLTIGAPSWAGGEQQDGRLVSSTVTRLELTGAERDPTPQLLQRLPTQFPNLRELAAWNVTVDDAGLEALLRLPHLERLGVAEFTLQRSHSLPHERQLASLWVSALHVDSFARLPLAGIQACSGWGWVQPSAAAAAVAWVAQAIRRWGGRGVAGDSLIIQGHDVPALLATLGPLLAVLPAEQQRDVTISGLRNATPQQLQQLGQQLPPGVATLRLDSYALAPDAWPALLPSLPATVEELRLQYNMSRFNEQHVLALCQAAVRPIRVGVVVHPNHAQGAFNEALQRVRSALPLGAAGPPLVTLFSVEE